MKRICILIEFLEINDISNNVIEIFKKESIDGKAFLLLNKNILRNDFKLNMGTTIKLLDLVKYKQHN